MLVNQKIVLYLFINDSLRSCLCVLSSERKIEILDELGMNKTIPATANTSTQGPIPVIKKDDLMTGTVQGLYHLWPDFLW